MIGITYSLIPVLAAITTTTTAFVNLSPLSSSSRSSTISFSSVHHHSFRHGDFRSNQYGTFLHTTSPSDQSWERDWGEPYESQLDSYPLPPLPTNPTRQRRQEKERSLLEKYARGDELAELRKNIKLLTQRRDRARKEGDREVMRESEDSLNRLLRQDAEWVLAKAKKEEMKAMDQGRLEDVKAARKLAEEARSCLPQFNLEGLWVGKYGSHGYEMINVTYSGDTLIAYKITGDKNVPKGEITFRADLTPNPTTPLEPIALSDAATRQWGIRHLTRFPGEGQVASEGYVKKEWIEGQLLMIGKYFSFAWVPLGHQIFFGRPSAELTLKMLKDSRMSSLRVDENEEQHVVQMRDFVSRCYEETMILEEDEEVDSQYYYSSIDGLDECGIDDNCFQ